MFSYFINSYKRKIARRITKKYPIDLVTFDVGKYGTVKHSQWGNPLFLNKSILEDEVDFFGKYIKEGDLAIDIGANIGHESIQMGLVTGKTGMTLSFDPNPYVYEILVQNAKANADKTNIVPNNFAITHKEEEFYYSSSEASFSNGGISSMPDQTHGKYTFPFKIKGIVLEPFLEKNYPDFIDKLKLVKIDTEGYDKEIIRSISSLLMKYKPTVITECFFRNNEEERAEHFNLLKAVGYNLYYVSEFSSHAEIVPILTAADMMKWKHFDIVATI